MQALPTNSRLHGQRARTAQRLELPIKLQAGQGPGRRRGGGASAAGLPLTPAARLAQPRTCRRWRSRCSPGAGPGLLAPAPRGSRALAGGGVVSCGVARYGFHAIRCQQKWSLQRGTCEFLYDPTCGSGGLLIKARLLFEGRHSEQRGQAPHLFGQELNAVTYAMAKMNMFLHDYTDSSFASGDTLKAPGFAGKGAGLRHFDYVVANPMWNQDGYDDGFYESDEFHRFPHGAPPRSSADWAWAQHILASLNDTGRAAVVLDTGAVSRGSGSKSANKERDIRRALVEADLIEGVVLLPENLFYNTSAPGIILLLSRAKPAARRGQFLLINASQYFVKEKPKNALTDAGIAAVAEVYRAWETRPKLARVVTLEEVRAADYNLSPSQFVEVADPVEHRPLAEILADLATARSERERADAALAEALAKLGLEE